MSLINTVYRNTIAYLKTLGKPAGFLLLLLASIVFAFVIKTAEIKGAVMILLLLIGPIAVFAVISNPKIGVIMLYPTEISARLEIYE